MKILVPGHHYLLDNLKQDGETELQFYQDGFIHDRTIAGPSTQEVLRACIDRVNELDKEKPWELNYEIIHHLRMAIALFEMRALYYKVEKGWQIENTPCGEDGHIWLIR
ncbi:MAG TPA: hypothetical protein VLG09_03970 [Candidatus Saccharimonadales bacterium]|nr:hypothetical protein [Candidatus Saccharimonadales bacterium]